jgi:hypothetical protein
MLVALLSGACSCCPLVSIALGLVGVVHYCFLASQPWRIRVWHMWLCVGICFPVGVGLGYISAIYPLGRDYPPSQHEFAEAEFLVGSGGGLLVGLALGAFLWYRAHWGPRPAPAASTAPALPELGPRWAERNAPASPAPPADAVQPGQDRLSSDHAGTDP